MQYILFLHCMQVHSFNKVTFYKCMYAKVYICRVV